MCSKGKRIIWIDIPLPLNDFLNSGQRQGVATLYFLNRKNIIWINILLPLNDFLNLDNAGGLQPYIF